MLPVPAHGCLRFGCVAKALSVEVKHGKLVLGEDVRVGMELDAAPDVAEHVLEIVLDIGIEFAFGVTRDIDCSLRIERADAVHVGGASAHHAFVGVQRCRSVNVCRRAGVG